LHSRHQSFGGIAKSFSNTLGNSKNDKCCPKEGQKIDFDFIIEPQSQAGQSLKLAELAVHSWIGRNVDIALSTQTQDFVW
jgi:hypothetical protein